MSIEDSSIKTVENNDDTLEFPLRLSKLCLLNLRHESTFISPLSIETAYHALSYVNNHFINTKNKNLPFYFHNYFILNKESIKSFHQDINEEVVKYFNTEFQIYTLTDFEQKKLILNEILKKFSQQTLEPFILSQKILGQIILEPMSLLSCNSLIFRPFKNQSWEKMWSLKFHSNIHLPIETEFYFTKGFFRVAFHNTFHKIEIPGEIFNEIQMKLIILLPQCSSDLVDIYANIKEYLNLPYSLAFIGVCIPNISMNIDMNLIESLKIFHDLYNLNELNEQIHLSAAHFLGHFVLDMSPNKNEQTSLHCLHSIDLSPVTPWVFFANRPFLFLITYGDYYLLIGQMLGPKIDQKSKKLFL